MPTQVLFIDEYVNGKSTHTELYTRIGLKRLKYLASPPEKDEYSSTWEINQNKYSASDLESDDDLLLEIFKQEKIEQVKDKKIMKSKAWLPSSPKTADPASDFINKKDMSCNDEFKGETIKLSVDTMVMRDSLVQYGNIIDLSDIDLIGPLQSMPLDIKFRWFHFLFYEKGCHSAKYTFELRDNVFFCKMKITGLDKPVFKIELKDVNITMNGNILLDLKREKNLNIKLQSQKEKWINEKAVLHRTILKMSELLGFNKANDIVGKQNQFVNLESVFSLEERKKQSGLASLVSGAKNVKQSIREFYVPFLQFLQNESRSLKERNIDLEKGLNSMKEFFNGFNIDHFIDRSKLDYPININRIPDLLNALETLKTTNKYFNNATDPVRNVELDELVSGNSDGNEKKDEQNKSKTGSNRKRSRSRSRSPSRSRLRSSSIESVAIIESKPKRKLSKKSKKLLSASQKKISNQNTIDEDSMPEFQPILRDREKPIEMTSHYESSSYSEKSGFAPNLNLTDPSDRDGTITTNVSTEEERGFELSEETQLSD